MSIFLAKTLKICGGWGLCPQTPLASGGWGLCPLTSGWDTLFAESKTSHSQSTRYSASDHLRIPLYKTNRLQRSIKFVAPKIWNSIPLKVRKTSYANFKKEYKTYLPNTTE